MDSASGQMWERWIGGSFKTTWHGMKVGTLILKSVETNTFPLPKKNRPQSELMPVVPVMPVAPLMKEQTLVRETESIVLVFQTNGKPFIQEVYTLQHDWLGTFDLLLVPASAATAGSKYTAVITHVTGRMVPME
ncbi:MAG TPA: hypothetical protein VKB38_03150 [Terracidiphilus sp.]|nr:hypothetical protein [Terracidiphilus sp.]